MPLLYGTAAADSLVAFGVKRGRFIDGDVK